MLGFIIGALLITPVVVTVGTAAGVALQCKASSEARLNAEYGRREDEE